MRNTFWFLALLVVGCSGNEPTAFPELDCQAGSQQACECLPDLRSGIRICADDGAQLGACVCEESAEGEAEGAGEGEGEASRGSCGGDEDCGYVLIGRLGGGVGDATGGAMSVRRASFTPAIVGRTTDGAHTITPGILGGQSP